MLMSIPIALLGAYWLIIAATNSSRSPGHKVALKVSGLSAWLGCYLITASYYPSIQALFIWLALISIAAITTLFITPALSRR